MVAPAAILSASLARVHGLIAKMLMNEAALKRMAGWGLTPMRKSQPEFFNFVRAEYSWWSDIVRAVGITPQ